MDYEGTLIRPPSEADSLIFQVTLGCTDNHCIFCPAYKDKKFHIKDIGQIENEFRRASKNYHDARRIFFADGDAIVIQQEKLLEIFDLATKYFPNLTRVSLYGSIKSLENKSVDDLIELKKRKLGVIYMGMETGDNEVYRFIRKYGSPKGNIDTCLKIKESGIKTNVTVILGLGGKKSTGQHAENTAGMLNACKPEQIAALTLMIVPGTPLHNMLKKGEFEELGEFEMMEELHSLISNIEDFRCLFFSNHASNYYQINARLPKDKPAILEELKNIIRRKDRSKLTPDILRGL